LISKRLADSFGYIGDFIDRPGQRVWMPLLFLNGSSVTTGRRIVVSDVQPWYCGRKLLPLGMRQDETAKPFQIYPQAYDFFELRSGVTGLTSSLKAEGFCNNHVIDDNLSRAPDIAMSTAATLSARFPIISPHGIIRNMSGDIVDRVVDGGYFENDGLATARDVIKALLAAGLRPILVRVTNDPVPAGPRGEGGATTLVRINPPEGHKLGWLSSALTPITGLYNTRAGHGAEAANAAFEVYDLADRSEQEQADPGKFLEIRVYDLMPDTSLDPGTGQRCMRRNQRHAYPARMKDLSMSWWLSQPVQEYLDAQLCHPDNQQSLRLLGCALRKGGDLQKSCHDRPSPPNPQVTVSGTAPAQDRSATASR